MRIQRAAFLSLVSAIAASCSSAGTPLPDPPDAGRAPPPAGADDDDDAPPHVDGGVDAAPVCDDDDGITTTCKDINGQGLCSQLECEATLGGLKSRVARKQIECMREQIKLGTYCDGCRRQALESACPDGTAAEVCDELEQKCVGKPLDRKQCLQLAAGMTFGSRVAFLYCATESDCKRSLGECLEFTIYP